MKFNHRPYCDCFECTALPEHQLLGERPVNHADITSTSNPGYYQGATLVSKKYTTSYSLPGSDAKGNPKGSVVKKYSPGDTIGVIYSYFVDPVSKLVWWELTDNKNEWLLHQPGYFDAVTAATTASGKTFNDEQAALIESQGFFNTLSNGAKIVGSEVSDSLGLGNLKWILIGVGVLIVIIAVGYTARAFK